MKALRWIGPALLSALAIAVVVDTVYWSGHPTVPSAGKCRARPDVAGEIRRQPVLNVAVHPGQLDEPTEDITCGDPGSYATVTRHLATSATGAGVKAFYADLAQREGWQTDPMTAGLFSARKPAGACPWWFVLRPDKDDRGGYLISVFYQPAGAAVDDCVWVDGTAMLLTFHF